MMVNRCKLRCAIKGLVGLLDHALAAETRMRATAVQFIMSQLCPLDARCPQCEHVTLHVALLNSLKLLLSFFKLFPPGQC